MRISERDEILAKYASNLQHNDIQKLAWDWADIAQGLGIDALIGGAVGGGAAALSGGSVGAGILGGIGLTSNPVGWVLLAAGVAATVYTVTRQTDDNIEDLITRLEALDPNPRAQNIINGWIQTLQGYQSYFDIQTTAQDPKQRATQLGQQIAGLTEVLKYLKQMQVDWPQVKANLTDIAFDAGQAETALAKTTQATEAGLTAIRQTAQQEGSKLVKQLGQQSGVDYTQIAEQVLALHEQIAQIDGNPPEYEEYEKPAFQLAQNILAGKAELQDIAQLGPQMKALLKGLQEALRRAQKKQRRTRTSSELPPISKRAVRLSGESSSTPASGGGGRARPSAGPAVAKDPAVVALQKSINYLNLNLRTGIARIAEDGSYGTNTANALVALLEKVPVLEEHLMRRVGIDKQSVADIQFMKENSDYFAGMVSVISSIVNQMYPAAGTGQKPAASEYDQQVQCREDKENPKPAEILACLRARQIRDPQTEEVFTAYEYLKQRGMKDNDIVALIGQLFGGARSEDWSMPLLVKYVSGPRFTAFRSY